VQHIIPIALLTLPLSPGLLLVATLVMVNLFRMAVIAFTRPVSIPSPLTVLLRLFVLILLGILFYRNPGHRNIACRAPQIIQVVFLFGFHPLLSNQGSPIFLARPSGLRG